MLRDERVRQWLASLPRTVATTTDLQEALTMTRPTPLTDAIRERSNDLTRERVDLLAHARSATAVTPEGDDTVNAYDYIREGDDDRDLLAVLVADLIARESGLMLDTDALTYYAEYAYNDPAQARDTVVSCLHEVDGTWADVVCAFGGSVYHCTACEHYGWTYVEGPTIGERDDRCANCLQDGDGLVLVVSLGEDGTVVDHREPQPFRATV